MSFFFNFSWKNILTKKIFRRLIFSVDKTFGSKSRRFLIFPEHFARKICLRWVLYQFDMLWIFGAKIFPWRKFLADKNFPQTKLRAAIFHWFLIFPNTLQEKYVLRWWVLYQFDMLWISADKIFRRRTFTAENIFSCKSDFRQCCPIRQTPYCTHQSIQYVHK